MKIAINNKSRSDIPLELVEKTARIFLSEHNIDKELSIAFIGDQKMRGLNLRYRGFGKTTDILSFEGDDGLWGELLVNFQQIKRQSAKYGHSPENELVFILVHGLLHLLGLNDEDEAGRREMIRLGKNFIRKHDLYV